jgi:hypothetical protein
MAFIYDPTGKCVHDPVGNQTLRRVHQYRDGECDFDVEGPNSRIAFTAQSKATFPGPVIDWLVWKVRVTGEVDQSETPQQIISQALAIYKQFNALPEQGSVRVTFVDATG